jgi:iron(III) transport system ATP-binding protein
VVDVFTREALAIEVGQRLASGGQKQRVALARAIVYQPKVVLFDEPLSNLDAKLREQMRVELARLQRDVGITSIYVTHDQAEALVMSDRIVVMNEGTVQQIGDPQTIYWRPANTFVARFIGVASLIEGTVLGRDAQACDVEIRARPGERPLRIRAASDRLLTRGSTIQLCLRPEDIALHTSKPTHTGHVNVLPGRVLGTAYLGTYVECRVGVGSHELCVRSGNTGDLTPGQQVFLTFDPAHAIRVT